MKRIFLLALVAVMMVSMVADAALAKKRHRPSWPCGFPYVWVQPADGSPGYWDLVACTQ